MPIMTMSVVYDRGPSPPSKTKLQAANICGCQMQVCGCKHEFAAAPNMQPPKSKQTNKKAAACLEMWQPSPIVVLYPTITTSGPRKSRSLAPDAPMASFLLRHDFPLSCLMSRRLQLRQKSAFPPSCRLSYCRVRHSKQPSFEE